MAPIKTRSHRTCRPWLCPGQAAARNRVRELPPLELDSATTTSEFLRPGVRYFLDSLDTARRLWRRLPHRLGSCLVAPGIVGAVLGGDRARHRTARQGGGTDAAPAASDVARRSWLVGGYRPAINPCARGRRAERPARRRRSR